MNTTKLNNGIDMPVVGIGTLWPALYEEEDQVEKTLKRLDTCEIKPTVLQVEAHPYYPENELKEFLAKQDIKIQSWYPLGHGDKI